MYVKPALAASAGGIHQVFVYGTLKNEQSNHRVLGPKRILKGHSRAQGFIMVDLGAFPGAVRAPKGGWGIYGEVYEIGDEAFKNVDNLEGYPGFYGREVIDLDFFGKAWIYTLPADRYLRNGCRFIPCGRWTPTAQAYVFTEDRLNNNYEITRPLIPAIGRNNPPVSAEPKGIIVPESAVKPKPSETPLQVGPGWEEG